MPELAEVEIIRRGLAAIVGRRITDVKVVDPKLATLSAADLVGRRIVGVRRHGKLLGLELDSGEVLALHLRMTGSLLLWDDPKARLSLHFEPEGHLSFVDPRRFGTVRLLAGELFGLSLGPDLFDADEELLVARAGRSRRAVKACLLDQAVVAGVGNYMADEALWRARLAPMRPAHTLTAADWSRLLGELEAVARESLARGGVSIAAYRHVDGALGRMQESLSCYGRAGEPCLECGRTLAKTIVAGRGTTYCPYCQH